MTQYFQLTPDILLEYIYDGDPKLNEDGIKGNMKDIYEDSPTMLLKSEAFSSKYLCFKNESEGLDSFSSLVLPINNTETQFVVAKSKYQNFFSRTNASNRFLTKSGSGFLYLDTNYDANIKNENIQSCDVRYDKCIVHFTSRNYFGTYDSLIFQVYAYMNDKSKLYFASFLFKRTSNVEMKPEQLLYNERLYTTQIEFDIPSVFAILSKDKEVYNELFNEALAGQNIKLLENTPIGVNVYGVSGTTKGTDNYERLKALKISSISIPYVYNRFDEIHVNISEAIDGDFYYIDPELGNGYSSFVDYIESMGEDIRAYMIMHELTLRESWVDTDGKQHSETTHKELHIIDINEDDEDDEISKRFDAKIKYRPICMEGGLNYRATIVDTIKIINTIDSTSYEVTGSLEILNPNKYGKKIKKLDFNNELRPIVNVYNKGTTSSVNGSNSISNSGNISGSKKVGSLSANFSVEGGGTDDDIHNKPNEELNSSDAKYFNTEAKEYENEAQEFSDKAQKSSYKAQSFADRLQEDADKAKEVTDRLQEDADKAKEVADNSGLESDREIANQAQEAANKAKEISNQAQEAADKAQEVANNVKEAADKAQEASDKAQEAADKAQEATNKAQEAFQNGDLENENKYAIESKNAAQDANDASEEAKNYANIASGNDSKPDYELDSNDANDFTSEAQEAADKAQEAADKAQERADEAKEVADKSGLESDIEVANITQLAADKAQEAADKAKEQVSVVQEYSDKSQESSKNENFKEENKYAIDAKIAAKEAIDAAKEASDYADKTLNSKDANQFKNEAQESANKAKEESDKAKESADKAKEAADKSGLESDRTIADKAKEAADKAKDASDKAQEAADKAKEAANKSEESNKNGNFQDENKYAIDASNAAKESSDYAKEASDSAKEANDYADNTTGDGTGTISGSYSGNISGFGNMDGTVSGSVDASGVISGNISGTLTGSGGFISGTFTNTSAGSSDIYGTISGFVPGVGYISGTINGSYPDIDGLGSLSASITSSGSGGSGSSGNSTNGSDLDSSGGIIVVNKGGGFAVENLTQNITSFIECTNVAVSIVELSPDDIY